MEVARCQAMLRNLALWKLFNGEKTASKFPLMNSWLKPSLRIYIVRFLFSRQYGAIWRVKHGFKLKKGLANKNYFLIADLINSMIRLSRSLSACFLESSTIRMIS